MSKLFLVHHLTRCALWTLLCSLDAYDIVRRAIVSIDLYETSQLNFSAVMHRTMQGCLVEFVQLAHCCAADLSEGADELTSC
ncbi:uncharacterized protein L969DRAFT_87500 [Mixia osmundae IAM 14324]|uniref:uncharacterized protein n=1 Tax=Mixia osmundae (strain CBS 9802 / IAM 14324 / JCM 22182 / KY 12970) TaxID=764103 RepID=UPI0004A54830|nr:uncharacterized protein L969DRAFT_87500 [Mixia osmundae IAM 14324]KEI39550.1 hypothetical protein L969DRAFT_87500 [Mixia osmundae IAM 14324]